MKDVPRVCSVTRETMETQVSVRVGLDGQGSSSIETGIPFFDHMLSLFAKHGLFELEIKAKGDLPTGYHHTFEDVGLCLGEAVMKALGDKAAINRFGASFLPMDETLVAVAVDVSGRPNLVYNLTPPKGVKFDKDLIDMFDSIREFFKGFAQASCITLHINLQYGKDIHHIFEATFKGVGLALRDAVAFNERVKGVPSTKGKL
jgi:imidazoleglycerol-phosphate dehydratase